MGTGIEREKIRIVDKDELVDKGEEIYEKIKDKLEPEHKGEIVAIEVKTRDYFLGKDMIEADEKARETVSLIKLFKKFRR